MSPYASFIFLFLISFFSSFRASAQNPTFLHAYCPNTTTYSRDSTYFTNLRTVLSSLSSPNASYSTGFQNFTAGKAPDRVTGLFFCRGDLSLEACRSCVAFSVNQTLVMCPNEKEAVFYYEKCMLRYSHQNIISTLNYDGRVLMMNTNNISSHLEDRFGDLLSSTMNQAAVEAANNSRKFYTIKANWTALQSLYVLVQCTPDLRRQDCLACLQESINHLSFFRAGGRLLWPSCNSRYELYPFYNEQQAPPVSSPQRPRKGGKSNVLVVAIVMSIVDVVLLFIGGFYFLTKRTKKTSDTRAFDGLETLE